MPSKSNDTAEPRLYASMLNHPISSLIASASLPSSEKTTSKRKSHGRKRPPGHISRPPNAFILFRCDFVRAKSIPEDVEHDHRNISRIAGKVWQDMSMKDKQPWVCRAERIRRQHKLDHPAFYGDGARKRIRLHADTSSLSCRSKQDAERLAPTPPDHSVADQDRANKLFPPFDPPLMLPSRRSSSCPPQGAAPIPMEFVNTFSHINGAMDDSSGRRPSCIVKYRLTNIPSEIPVLPAPGISFADPILPLSWDCQSDEYLNVEPGQFSESGTQRSPDNYSSTDPTSDSYPFQASYLLQVSANTTCYEEVPPLQTLPENSLFPGIFPTYQGWINLPALSSTIITPLDGGVPAEMISYNQSLLGKISHYPSVMDNTYYDLFEAGCSGSYFTRRTSAGGYLQ